MYGIHIKATDPGIGVNRLGWSSPNAPGWGKPVSTTQRNECYGAVQCTESLDIATNTLYSEELNRQAPRLPEGEDTIEARAENATGASATAVSPYKVKIDNLAPTMALGNVPADGEVSGSYTLKAIATDGTVRRRAPRGPYPGER